MNLNLGTLTYNKLARYAADSDTKLDEFTAEMINIGLSFHESNLKKEEKDPEINEIQQLLIENNRIVKEVIRCVFDKTKTSVRVFDANTLVIMIENETEAFLRGQLNKIS